MPLAFLLTIVLAAKPAWRRRAGFIPAVAAAVVFVVTLLAVLSGQAFDEVVGDRVDTSDHEGLAIITVVLVGCFFLASTSLAIVDRWRGKGGPPWLASATLASLTATVLLAATATWWMVQTGEEGARLVWDGVITSDDS